MDDELQALVVPSVEAVAEVGFADAFGGGCRFAVVKAYDEGGLLDDLDACCVCVVEGDELLAELEGC